MALSVNQIQKAYIAFFNRPADPTGLAYWSATSTASVEDLLNTFSTAPEYTAQYAGKTNAQIVDTIYQNLFGRGAETEGLFFWAGHLDAGTLTIGNVAWTILNSANDGPTVKDLTTINNKAEAATAFTDYLALPGNAAAKAAYETGGDAAAKIAKDWLSSVGASTASKDGAVAGIANAGDDLIDAATGGGTDPGTPDDGTIYIGERPLFVGTDANNTFVAGVGAVDDNTVIDGKGGYDTLRLTIGDDAAGIAPTVLNVEKVVVRGQHTSTLGAPSGQDNNISDGATLDADRFDGAVRWWESNNSRTDVKIEDIRIADGLLTKDITIAFTESDPGHVDFAVYFDQSSLRNQGSSLGTLIATVFDYANASIPGNGPLTSNVFNVLNIRIDGVLKTIEFADVKGATATYDDLLAAVKAAIEASTDPLVRQLTVALGGKTIQLTNDAGVPTHVAPDYLVLELANHTLTEGNWSAVGGTPPSGGIDYYQTSGLAEFNELVTSTIVLDYVGRGSKGGDLVIGGLSTGETSTSLGVQQFDITVKRDSQLEVISSTNNTLQVVNIKNEGTNKYQGAYEQREPGDSASIARYGDLYAQGDTKVQTLVNDLSGTKKVGPYTTDLVSASQDQDIDGATNAQNNGYAFTDVREINAAGFQGNLKLNAILTANVVDKYLNIKDGAPALAAADNVEFNYDLGSNNDVFDLAISSANLAAAGTTTREDFILEINGNGGNDIISTVIYDYAPGLDWTNSDVYTTDGLTLMAATDTTPWYINNHNYTDRVNLTIDAGSGSDVINTFGSGDWNIILGTGSDTYYAVNTADKAAWVFNTTDQTTPDAVVTARDLEDLVSSANDRQFLYKTAVRVTYVDADGTGTFVSKDIVIPSTNYRTSDLQINQAIKTAINSDPVLGKLLVAEDGPANTLVVRALSDGEHLAADLNVDFIVPNATAYTTADVTGFKAALVSAGVGTAAAVETLIGTTGASLQAWLSGTHLAATNVAIDYASALANTATALDNGAYSSHVSDNHIYVSAGSITDHDVVVLSTGELSNDTLVWEGYNSNTVTVVNFDTGTAVSGAGKAASLMLDFGDIGDPLLDGASVFVVIPGLNGGNPIELVAASSSTQTVAGNGAWVTDGVANALDALGLGTWTRSDTDLATTGAQTWTNGTVGAVPGIGAVPAGNFFGLSGGTLSGTFTDGTAATVDVGEDFFDFSAYGARWVGAGLVDSATKLLSGTWDTDGASLTLTANQKYITLTHEIGSTLYEIREWTAVAGGGTTALGDAFTANANDSFKLIGFVDVGRLIEDGGAAANTVLDHIILV
ncbi:hypothetical protein AGMMS50256_28010 [Betaproteobacteria bacterium]|nr:hypothetical protein AGMMS50256_28010 [Betaproteobacteria bacterium]